MNGQSSLTHKCVKQHHWKVYNSVCSISTQHVRMQFRNGMEQNHFRLRKAICTTGLEAYSPEILEVRGRYLISRLRRRGVRSPGVLGPSSLASSYVSREPHRRIFAECLTLRTYSVSLLYPKTSSNMTLTLFFNLTSFDRSDSSTSSSCVWASFPCAFHASLL